MSDLIHSDSRWLADGTAVRLRAGIRRAEAEGGTIRYVGGRKAYRRAAVEAAHEARRPGWRARREERKRLRTLNAQQIQRERREAKMARDLEAASERFLASEAKP